MNESAMLSAADAAVRLGVKRQTLYAYVSRGLLGRQVAMDGRMSLFDPKEIDALRLGKRDRTEGELRAVIATAITQVNDDGLLVRGHDLVELVQDGQSFTAIADLLWEAEPGEEWPKPELQHSSAIGGIDALRAIVAHASASDALRHDLSPKSVRSAGRRMITEMVHGLPAQAKGTDTSLSGALWRRLTSRRATAAQRAALDVALALLADHGLAASTFATRIAASVRGDPYSVVTAGLGVLGGALHGGSSATVHDLFAEAHHRRDAALAVGDILRTSGRVPGFGHMVYTRQDPRYGVLMKHVVDAWATDPRLQTVYGVRDVVASRRDVLANVDLAVGAFTWLAGMPASAGEVIFAVARTAGWLAHAIEEYDEPVMRFRPRARYVGLR